MSPWYCAVAASREVRAAAIGLLVLAAFSGCKKKSASGPPPDFPAQVVLAEAKRQPIAETLALVGSLAANEIVEVKSETDGTIAEIAFNEGQEVKKGDLLIHLEESKFSAALAESEASLKLNEATFERNKQLFREKLISQQEYDQSAAFYQAQQATVDLRKRLLRDTRIYAPFSGVVGARSLSPGQVIARNTTLTWLVDADTIKAEFNVPERFMGELKLKQQLDLVVAAFPKEKFRGEVYFIAPNVEDQSRTVLAKARVPNGKRLLKPGMFANLELTLQVRDDAIVIPESAVMLSSQGASVWVQARDGTAQLRPVQLGIRLAGRVEVASGLNSGENVVAEGIQKVAPGRKLIPAGPKVGAATNSSSTANASGH